MNGASKIPPIKLKIFDDTQEGCPTKYIAALNAKTEVIDPAIVRNKIEHVKSVTKKAINDYYRNPINEINVDEKGRIDENKALVLDYTDATVPLQQLYTNSNDIADMIGKSIEPLYDEAVKVCDEFQYKANQYAWDQAYSIRNAMGENARIIEVYGGSN